MLEQFSDKNAARALTMLTRLAARQPRQRRFLVETLRSRLEELADIALDVAVETGEPIGGVLAELIEHEISIDLVGSILARFDESRYRDSYSLTQVMVVSTQRILNHNQELVTPHNEEQVFKIARFNNNMGFALSLSGNQEQALEAARKAVVALRSSPSVRERDYQLALSLSNLGVVENNRGNYEGALPLVEESVRISRALALEWPEKAEPVLGQSLLNLGSILFSSGSTEMALGATREAVELFQRLANKAPGTFLTNLARSLNNLGAILRTLGRFDEALDAATHSLSLRRGLAESYPDFEADLAASLQNIARTLREQVSRRDEALPLLREAVAIRRRIASQRPDAALPAFAESLEMLAVTLLEVPEHGTEALTLMQEAVEIRRRVATAELAENRLALVDSLEKLAAAFLEMDDRESAFRALMESSEILHRAEASPPAQVAVRFRTVLDLLSQALEDLDVTADPTMKITSLEHVVRSITFFFCQQPLIFADPMNTAVLTYLATLLRMGTEPDRELLRPIVQSAEEEIRRQQR